MDVGGRAIVVSCGLAIGLLVSEALVRLLDIAPQVEITSDQAYRYSANPRLGWEPVPLAERPTLKRGINELGYRDLNHSVAKSPGVLRILVIGDSIAQGTRIKDDMAIFPRLLEAALRQ